MFPYFLATSSRSGPQEGGRQSRLPSAFSFWGVKAKIDSPARLWSRINFLSLPRKYEFNRGRGQSLSLLIYRHNVPQNALKTEIWQNFNWNRGFCVRLCYALS